MYRYSLYALSLIHILTPAATPVAAPSASAQNEEEVVAAIVGAIVAMGYSSEQIASIRPTAVSYTHLLSWHKRFTETGSMKK